MNLRVQDRPEAPVEDAPMRPRSTPATALVVVAMLVVAALVVILLAPTGRDPSPAVDQSNLILPDEVTVPRPTPAPLDLVGEARRLESADHFLRLHPNPDLVGSIYDVGNPVYADAVAFQKMLASGERRYDPLPEPWAIIDARVLSQSGDTARVILRFAATPRYRILDRAGQVLSDRPAGGPATAVWTLRVSGGQWRILGADTL